MHVCELIKFVVLMMVSVFSGAKFKKERTEPDDLFCEEKMLIIDGEFTFMCMWCICVCICIAPTCMRRLLLI